MTRLGFVAGVICAMALAGPVPAAQVGQAEAAQAREILAAAGVKGGLIVHSPMQEIYDRDQGPFDAILCLGNSLPHLLDAHQLTRALAGFARLLSPEGVVVLQLLNYARVLARQERIVGVTRQGDTEYVRFYDFLEDLVRFNVLKFTWSADGCTHDLAATLLHPYKRQEIAAACRTAGLGKIDCYGGGTFADFDEQNSDTLLVLAQPGKPDRSAKGDCHPVRSG